MCKQNVYASCHHCYCVDLAKREMRYKMCLLLDDRNYITSFRLYVLYMLCGIESVYNNKNIYLHFVLIRSFLKDLLNRMHLELVGLIFVCLFKERYTSIH